MALPSYDPQRHHRNKLGRWADRDTGRLVSLDPATLPPDPAPGLEVAAPGAPASGPAAVLSSAPVPPVPPVEAASLPGVDGSPGPSRGPASASSSPGPSGPLASGSLPGWAPIPTLDDPGLSGPIVAADVPHDPECWKAGAEGRPCPRCQTLMFGALPPEELGATVALHEMLVNRMTPYPAPYTESERAAVGGALQLLAKRYGNPMAEWTPLLALAGATMQAMGPRRRGPELPAEKPEGA